MTQDASSRQDSRVDPADELMEFLGLPAETKFDLWDALLDTLSPEYWGEKLEHDIEALDKSEGEDVER